MPANIPNILTWVRIIMIPIVVGVFYVPDAIIPDHNKNLVATVLFVLAAVTDWIDGWLARKLDQTSPFGAFLDPVADKLMVAAALIVLVELNRTSALIAMVIIGREIAISALREWMAKVGKSKSVAVNVLGKIKTVSQMVAIPMLLYHDPIGRFDPQSWGTVLIWMAALLTLVSMLGYIRRAVPALD
jgi:CDP-diacylglycerol--glycerol-3-phosphate 3-phosphatidyltransferase